MSDQTASRENFKGRIGLTAADASPGGRRARARPPARPTCWCRAGRHRLRAPRLFRLGHRHAAHRRARRARAALHQLPHHRAVLAHARLPAHRTQPPRGRHGRGLTNWTPASPTAAADHARAATLAEMLRGTATAPSRWASGTWPTMEETGRPARSSSGRCGAASTATTGSCGGATDQYAPELIDDNHPIDPPRSPAGLPPDRGPRRPGDRVRRDQQRSIAGEAVLDVPRARRDPLAAPGAARVHREVPGPLRRAAGTRCARRGSRARSELGIVPPDAACRRATPTSTAWDELAPTGDALCARLQEAFAGVPRPHRPRRSAGWWRSSKAIGELDNTLFVVLSDNGASQEGGRDGVLNEHGVLQRLTEPVAEHGGAHRRHRRPEPVQQLPARLGAGRQHAAASSTSRTRTAAASATR